VQKNKAGLDAALGNAAKYYCGGTLIGKCSCCDGGCGPDNGENCDACMQLDVQRWKLDKGYLVNTGGFVCQVLRIQGMPRVSCLMFERQDAPRAFSRAWAKTGKRIAARIAMMAITTKSSISVNPALDLDFIALHPFK
jgi:hypothetical protein